MEGGHTNDRPRSQGSTGAYYEQNAALSHPQGALVSPAHLRAIYFRAKVAGKACHSLRDRGCASGTVHYSGFSVPPKPLTFVRTDLLSRSRLMIFTATVFRVTQCTPNFTSPARWRGDKLVWPPVGLSLPPSPQRRSSPLVLTRLSFSQCALKQVGSHGARVGVLGGGHDRVPFFLLPCLPPFALNSTPSLSRRSLFCRVFHCLSSVITQRSLFSVSLAPTSAQIMVKADRQTPGWLATSARQEINEQ